MPEPVRRGQRYMPGLDGLRAIAVLAVVAYHLGAGWAQGGLLGVGVFFTLSGYLITDLLLAQARRSGRVQFKAFWLARARRLLPALFLMLVVVTAWVAVIGPHQPADFRTAVLTAAGYLNNWWLIFHDVSYFARFEAPSPLNHLWSLSIEEQFYIVWPFLLLLGIRLVPEARYPTGVRPRLACLILGIAAISCVLMVVLYEPSLDPSRVYYGTDTRAMELLVGAALAMVWPSRQLRPGIPARARAIVDAAGILGLLVIGVMFWRSGEFSPFLYRGGFLLLAVATAVVVAALAHPASRLGPIVGCAPMRWIGERSYGIYLWHFPVIVLTTPEGVRTTSLPRDALQLAAIFVIAELSWRFVENPIRHGALRRWVAKLRAREIRRDSLSRTAWGAATASAVVAAIAVAGLAGVGTSEEASAVGSGTVTKTVTAKKARLPHATSCEAVVHIGDSTSEGLVSEEYVRSPEQLISAQYARVGAVTQHLEVSGARSIYERFEGLPNAEEVALAWKAEGFEGCWVLALGTNEAANVAAGSAVGYEERIETMMSAIAGQPVMWVSVKSLLTDSPYAAENMESWDVALLEGCDRNPNMRVYDWAAEVRDSWFVEDGIHFTTPGYAARGRGIANALRNAFPASEPVAETDSDDCVVGSAPVSGPGAEAEAAPRPVEHEDGEEEERA